MRNLQAVITHWTSTRTFSGMTFSSPVIMRARWETVRKLFRGPTGDQEMSDAQVMVENSVAVGDYIFLGESTATDPRPLDGAFEVRSYSEMPNLRNVTNEKVAMV